MIDFELELLVFERGKGNKGSPFTLEVVRAVSLAVGVEQSATYF